jgi:hypothetical protein
MKNCVLLTGVVLLAVGTGSAIKALTLAPSASIPPPTTVTISTEDIQRQVDVASLPMREVREPF